MHKSTPTPFKTQPPPAELVRDVIRTRGYHDALNELAGARIYLQSANSIVFGHGITPYPITVHKLPDGTVECEKMDIPLRTPGPRMRDELGDIWSSAAQKARSVITRKSAHALGCSIDTGNYDDGDAYAHSLNPVTTEIDLAAAGLQAQMGIGYAEQPGRLLRHILGKFLSRKTMRAAIRYGGNTATLTTYNTAALYAQTLEEAYRLCPQALIFWMADRDAALSQLESGVCAEDIIDTVRISERGRFDIITSLSIKLMRELHPNTKRFRKLIDSIEETGTVPSYTICRFAASSLIPSYSTTETRTILAELFSRSLRPRVAQKELARDARIVMEERNSYNLDITPEMNWDDIVDHARAVRKESNRRRREQMKAAASSRPARIPVRTKKTRRVNPTFAQAEEHLTETVIRRIKETMAEDIPVRSDESGVALRIRGESADYMSLSRNDAGLLKVFPPFLDMNGISDISSFSSMGFGQAALAQIVAEELARIWQAPSDVPDRRNAVMWLPKIKPLLGDASKYDDEAITETVREFLLENTDPKTAALANARHGYANIWQYNQMALETGALDEMAGNPVVRLWLSRDHQAIRSITDGRHPGEVVSAVRERMKTMGFDIRLWKRLNRLSPEHIADALDARTESARRMFIAMEITVETGTAPHPQALATGLRDQFRTARNPGESANEERAARLMLTESALMQSDSPNKSQEILLSDFRTAMDYVRALDDEGQTLRSTTWSGLMKKSHRWHMRQNALNYAYQFQGVLDKFGGHYRTWKFAAEAMEIDGYTLRPLDSDLALYRETVEMSHCVAGYGGQCADDRSRIFAVYQGNEHIATGEIARYQNSPWQSVQTQGRHNHRVEQDVRDAMIKAAEIYDRAWNEMDPAERRKITMTPYSGDPMEAAA